MLSLQQLATSFSLGLLATTAPCVLPLYPGFLAYLSSNSQTLHSRRLRRLLGLVVLSGVLTMMLLIGLIVASLSVAIGSFLIIATPVADVAIVSLGILLLLKINPFSKLTQVRAPLVSNPFVNAYMYGLLFGPVVLPCSGPVAVGVFALSLSVGEFLGKTALFLVFGLGFGLPLLALSFISDVKGGWLTRLVAARHDLINRVAGAVLVLVGLYDFYINLPALRIYWSA
ncbi:MAG: hypothetical protein HY671_03405 [Chloroflexi bacterium]|nr:hypothetical protein [Chloroflexota bacterium]